MSDTSDRYRMLGIMTAAQAGASVIQQAIGSLAPLLLVTFALNAKQLGVLFTALYLGSAAFENYVWLVVPAAALIGLFGAGWNGVMAAALAEIGGPERAASAVGLTLTFVFWSVSRRSARFRRHRGSRFTPSGVVRHVGIGARRSAAGILAAFA
jgi:hypothetical protein